MTWVLTRSRWAGDEWWSSVRLAAALPQQNCWRDEARVSREGNRMVIRLVGLTFQSGQDVVRPQYRPLLEKLEARARKLRPPSGYLVAR